MTDVLRRNANLVEALGSAMRAGGHAIGNAPGLIKRVLVEESWREFVTQRGEHVVHDRFAEFVTALPLKGIGASVDLVRRIVSDDAEALDLLDQALQNPAHRPRSSDVITTSDDTNGRGTSREYALRRLRKDAPELHTEVLAGNLSAHAAMVKAGLRPKRFTVQRSSPDAVADTLRRQLPPEWLAEVAQHLAG